MLFRCPRCTGKVFPAEMFSMRNGKYHRKCFSCSQCKRALDYNIACDGPNSEIFCQPCYTKHFGAHVLYSQMEDKSNRTELIKPSKYPAGFEGPIQSIELKNIASKHNSQYFVLIEVLKHWQNPIKLSEQACKWDQQGWAGVPHNDCPVFISLNYCVFTCVCKHSGFYQFLVNKHTFIV